MPSRDSVRTVSAAACRERAGQARHPANGSPRGPGRPRLPGGLTAPPLRPAGAHSLRAWAPVPRSASSSPPAAPRSLPVRRGCACMAGGGARRGGAGGEPRCSPAARATTTPRAGKANPPASPARAPAPAPPRPRRDPPHGAPPLAHAPPAAPPRGTPGVAASVQHILDAAATAAAFARNGRLDLLAANALALYTPLCAGPARPANLARFCFLDPRSQELYPDWDDVANTTVALLRTEAGRDPLDRA